MVEKTTKQEIQSINIRLNSIDEHLIDLNKIEITVKNGNDKHITYRRKEFFQMLFDRKNVWKEKARLTAKDILLFGGVLVLIINNIFNIF